MKKRKTRQEIIEDAYDRFARLDIETITDLIGWVYDAAMKQARDEQRRRSIKGKKGKRK